MSDTVPTESEQEQTNVESALSADDIHDGDRVTYSMVATARWTVGDHGDDFRLNGIWAGHRELRILSIERPASTVPTESEAADDR